MLVDRDQAEGLGCQGITQHVGNLDAGPRTAPRRLCQHKLPGFGPAQVGNWLRMAFALINGREPALPCAVKFHHAHHLFGTGRQRRHGMGDPARCGLFGAGEYPITHAQRLLLALFDQAQARGRNVFFRLPAIRHGQGFAIIGPDHAQDGNLRHPTHPVEGGAIAVDQAFFGHVLEQGLKLDLLLPLQAEGTSDLPLAGGVFAIGDEIQYLLAARQAGLGLGAFHQVNKPGRRRCVPPPAGR